MYVIQRTDQGGGYVAEYGSKHSYTNRVEKARRYRTREEADTDRCPENEVVVELPLILST